MRIRKSLSGHLLFVRHRTTNKNLRDVITAMIPEFDSKQRYKVTGEYDAENRVMYFDMTTAVAASFFHKNAE